MCGHGFGTPNGGIPIPDWIHEQFPKDVQTAWTKFHNWWKKQNSPVSRQSMPTDIQQAYEIMKAAPIPQYEGFYGKDSCYVLSVEAQLTD